MTDDRPMPYVRVDKSTVGTWRYSVYRSVDCYSSGYVQLDVLHQSKDALSDPSALLVVTALLDLLGLIPDDILQRFTGRESRWMDVNSALWPSAAGIRFSLLEHLEHGVRVTVAPSRRDAIDSFDGSRTQGWTDASEWLDETQARVDKQLDEEAATAQARENDETLLGEILRLFGGTIMEGD
jgi:hypothetical protein